MSDDQPRHFDSFKEFYPYYLGEHQNPICRKLHFVGSTLVLAVVIVSIVTQKFLLLCLAPLVGYALAWVGHFFFEKNKPATFKYPFYSLVGDWVMWWGMLKSRK